MNNLLTFRIGYSGCISSLADHSGVNIDMSEHLSSLVGKNDTRRYHGLMNSDVGHIAM